MTYDFLSEPDIDKIGGRCPNIQEEDIGRLCQCLCLFGILDPETKNDVTAISGRASRGRIIVECRTREVGVGDTPYCFDNPVSKANPWSLRVGMG